MKTDAFVSFNPSNDQVAGRVVRPKAAFLLLTVLGLLSMPSAGAAAQEKNWPQWRGPRGDGVAPDANPPVVWSESKNVKWKVQIPGRGSATPIVWQDMVFVQTAVPTGKKVAPAGQAAAAESASNEQPGPDGRRRGGGRGMGAPKPDEIHEFVLLCLDRETGEVRWRQVVRQEVPHEGHHQADGTYASTSPVTDGKHIYAYFGSRGLYCFDMSGKLQWNQDLGDMRISNSFGEGSSPVLHGNTLVVNWDHEGDSFIAALDKASGKLLWKKPREEQTSWSTPLVVEHAGKVQVIAPATGKIRSYDLATGDVIWECGGLTRNVIPSPVAGDGLVYCMSGFRGNALFAIRLDSKGDITGTDSIVWEHKKSTPYVPSPLLFKDRLYFFSHNNGILSCFDAKTGKPLIDAERIKGLDSVYASPVAAGDRIYLVARNGTTVVLQPSDKLEILATNALDDKVDASPVPVGNQLLLRGREHLYCIAED